jgi:hypothetical protein
MHNRTISKLLNAPCYSWLWATLVGLRSDRDRHRHRLPGSPSLPEGYFHFGLPDNLNEFSPTNLDKSITSR